MGGDAGRHAAVTACARRGQLFALAARAGRFTQGRWRREERKEARALEQRHHARVARRARPGRAEASCALAREAAHRAYFTPRSRQVQRLILVPPFLLGLPPCLSSLPHLFLYRPMIGAAWRRLLHASQRQRPASHGLQCQYAPSAGAAGRARHSSTMPMMISRAACLYGVIC